MGLRVNVPRRLHNRITYMTHKIRVVESSIFPKKALGHRTMPLALASTHHKKNSIICSSNEGECRGRGVGNTGPLRCAVNWGRFPICRSTGISRLYRPCRQSCKQCAIGLTKTHVSLQARAERRLLKILPSTKLAI
jgi:hypothetical protein